MTAARTLLAEPLLTAEEVPRLARAIEAGLLAREARCGGGFEDATDEELAALEEIGQRAWRRFLRANLRLVALVAGQAAARSRLPEADLFQEGCLGLIAALQRFDHARGHTFATYALFWIRAAVGAGSARQLGALNLPTSRAEQLRAARGVETALTQRLGRLPSVAELAAALGRNEPWTASLLAHTAPEPLADVALALAAPVDDPFGAPGVEVRGLLARVPAAQRRVLELRFGFADPDGAALSLVETARGLGLSVGQVRRLEAEGLEVLREVCPQAAVWYLSA